MKLFLASPVYHAIDVDFFGSMLGLQRLCWQKQVDLQFPMIQGDSLVTRARDRLVQLFMRSNADRMVWIDSDIGFDPQDVLRLCQKPYDFMAAPYPAKGYPMRYIVNHFPQPRQTKDGLIEVRHAGTGFMIWTRKVAETLLDRCRHEPYKNSDSDTDWHYPVFKTPVVNGLLLSEDYHVCREWQESGGVVLLDPTVKLNHNGRHCFQGQGIET